MTHCTCLASSDLYLCFPTFQGLLPEQEDYASRKTDKPVHLGHRWPGTVSCPRSHLLPVIGWRYSGVRHHGPGLVPESEELGAGAEEDAGHGDHPDDSWQQDGPGEGAAGAAR